MAIEVTCPHGNGRSCGSAACRKLQRRARHWGDALTWIERNAPDGIRLVARALSETHEGANPPDSSPDECSSCGYAPCLCDQQ